MIKFSYHHLYNHFLASSYFKGLFALVEREVDKTNGAQAVNKIVDGCQV